MLTIDTSTARRFILGKQGLYYKMEDAAGAARVLQAMRDAADRR